MSHEVHGLKLLSFLIVRKCATTALNPKGHPNPVSPQLSAPDPVGGTHVVLTVARLGGSLCRGLVSPRPLAFPSAGGFHRADQPAREGVSFLHMSSLYFCVKIIICFQKLIAIKALVI